MNVRSIFKHTAVAFTIVFLFAQTGRGQSTPIRVLASNGVKAALDEMSPRLEAAGRAVAIQYDSTSSLEKKIEAGEPFDIAILNSEVVESLAKDRKIDPKASVNIARVGIGVGMRAGAPKPDIASPEAMKQTLLRAKSITYSQEGAARPYIEKMIDQLGIAATLKPKLVFLNGADSTGSVASGNTEFVITLISEIVPANEGVALAGPIPAAFQHYITFTTVMSAKASNPKGAKAVLGFLTSPAAAPVYKDKGMEPR